MNVRGPRAVRALLTLIAAIAGLLVSALAPTPAHAEEPVALVEITLNSINPALPTRDGKITLTGTGPTSPTSGSSGPRPTSGATRPRSPIGRASTRPSTLSPTTRSAAGRSSATRTSTPTTDPYLDPGETRDFTLTVPVADLELSPTDGVYLMGVHVLQNNQIPAVGRARIFVPVVGTPPTEQLQMTSLVTLTSRPSLVRSRRAGRRPPGRARSPRTAGSASCSPPLTTDNLSFAVDPALIEDLQTMAGGYAVLAGDGGTVPGTGAADAARWLEDFADSESRPRRIPAALRLARPGRAGPRRSAVGYPRQPRPPPAGSPLTRNLPLLVLPTGGRADAATVAAATTRPKAIVLSDRSAAGPRPAAGRTRTTVPDRQLSSAGPGGGPGPDPRDTAVQLQQRLLAETWIEATSAADGTARGRVRLITSAAQATRAYAGVEAPWLAPSPLSTLLQARPAVWSEKYGYPAAVRDAELTAGQLSSLRRFTATQRTYADLLVDGRQAEAAGGAAVARAASGAWRQQDRARQAFLGPSRRPSTRWSSTGSRSAACPRSAPSPRRGWCSPSPSATTSPRHRPRRQRGPGPAGLHLRQRPAADHQADRGAADPRSGQRHRRRRGDRPGQRHRAGHRPAGDRVRASGRRAHPAGGPGHPERHDRLADRARRRAWCWSAPPRCGSGPWPGSGPGRPRPPRRPTPCCSRRF